MTSCIGTTPDSDSLHLSCGACAGLGGIAFHLGQFHIGSLFPRARGVVSGTAVGGFVGSGIIFLLLKACLSVKLCAVAQGAAPGNALLAARGDLQGDKGREGFPIAAACHCEEFHCAQRLRAGNGPDGTLQTRLSATTDRLCMQAIVSSLGGSRAAFRGVFIVYGAYCSLWIPLSLWVIPKKSLQLGQVWRCTNPQAVDLLGRTSCTLARRRLRRRQRPAVHTRVLLHITADADMNCSCAGVLVRVADASVGAMQVYVMTQNFRFCTLTLDAYDSSRRDGAGTKLNGDGPHQHDGKPDLAAALKTEELEGADEGGDSSRATSVHGSAPTWPAAGDSCALRTAPDAARGANPASAANMDDCDPHNSIDNAGSGARREQRQHAVGIPTSNAAAQGMQQVVMGEHDSIGSRPAVSYPCSRPDASVASRTAVMPQMQSSHHSGVQAPSSAPSHSGSSARPAPGAGFADLSKRLAAPNSAEAVDVTSAVEPSEGVQTSTAVREHHGVDDRAAGSAVAGSVVVHTEGVSGAGADPDRGQEKAVVLREPARFAALKTRSLWRQLASAEAIGLTLFFTAHVLILQLYLGALPTLACSITPQHVLYMGTFLQSGMPPQQLTVVISKK